MKTLLAILLLSVSMLAQDKTTATLAAQVPFPFQANTPYVAGALVTNGGSVYSRISAGTSGASFAADSAKWTQVGGGGGGYVGNVVVYAITCSSYTFPTYTCSSGLSWSGSNVPATGSLLVVNLGGIPCTGNLVGLVIDSLPSRAVSDLTNSSPAPYGCAAGMPILIRASVGGTSPSQFLTYTTPLVPTSLTGTGAMSEVFRNNLLIPAGTYSGSVPGSSNTLSVCTSKRCYCTWQWIGITRTTAPTIRLNLTDATTSLAVNPFVIPDVLDTSGNPSAVASRTIILDSASGTTPSWDVYLSTTTASAIGVLTACSMVQ